MYTCVDYIAKYLIWYCTLAVPTVYPLNIFSQLSMVDTLVNIGISRHFSSDIKRILDKTYM